MLNIKQRSEKFSYEFHKSLLHSSNVLLHKSEFPDELVDFRVQIERMARRNRRRSLGSQGETYISSFQLILYIPREKKLRAFHLLRLFVRNCSIPSLISLRGHAHLGHRTEVERLQIVDIFNVWLVHWHNNTLLGIEFAESVFVKSVLVWVR